MGKSFSIAALVALCARPTAAQLSGSMNQPGIVLVRIETNASVYKLGEPIWLRVALINKSAHEFAIRGGLAPFQLINLAIIDARGSRLPSGPKPDKDSMIGNSGVVYRIPLPRGQPVYVGDWTDIKHWGYHIGRPGEYTLVATLANESNRVRIRVIPGRATNFAAPTSSPIPTIRVRTGRYSASTMQRSCATPNAEATVTNAVQPYYLGWARAMNLRAVTVEVEVVVGPTGKLSGASIYKSSSDPALDQEALRAARESTYSPRFVNCRPTEGKYLFRADLPPG